MKFFQNPMLKGSWWTHYVKSHKTHIDSVQDILDMGLADKEKTGEWIAVKLIKPEFNSLTYFNNDFLQNRLYSLCQNFCPNAIYM